MGTETLVVRRVKELGMEEVIFARPVIVSMM